MCYTYRIVIRVSGDILLEKRLGRFPPKSKDFGMKNEKMAILSASDRFDVSREKEKKGTRAEQDIRSRDNN